MNGMVMKILGAIYARIPVRMRLFVKKMAYWILMRVQSVASLRRVHKGLQINFVDFEIADLEKYEFLGPNTREVLVRVHKTLVSPGTEISVLKGLPGARRFFPYSPGYSAAGYVLQAGNGVKGMDPGRHVCGRIPHCSQRSISVDNLFIVPVGVESSEAAFIELGIIVLQGIRKARIRPGEKVAVIGQGLIGQLTNRFARVVGASPIVALAPSRNRANTATLVGGADEYIAFGNEFSLLDKIEADVVIEAVGSPLAVTAAMRCASIGGRVVLLGSSRGLGREVDIFSLAQCKNLKIIGAHISVMPEKDISEGRWTYRQEGDFFLELLKHKRLEVKDLVTWRAKPEECNSVYEVLAKGGGRHVGILFDWVADS